MSHVRLIPLTQGLFALVDATDYPSLVSRRWYTIKTGNQWYAVSRKEGRRIYMHRAILSPPPDMQVDHKNRDGLDNRRSNLRLATKAQNVMNAPARMNNASGYRGVSFHQGNGQWRAELTIRGKARYLGYFASPEQAAGAYDRAAREEFGEFAYSNLEVAD